jgi:response regulator RpfG family c-di-GMP phosphodiesterase
MTAQDADTGETGPKRILVVDDEPGICEMLQISLDSAGYETVVAPNAAEAQKIIEGGLHNLVLSDIRLPGMSGTELLKWVKEKHPKVRIVLMTGFSEIADTLDAAELGARGFLMKPFKTEALLDVLKKASMQVSWAEFDEKNFASMTISDFISPAALKFALFIRLRDGQFMKIGEPGDVVPRDKLLGLREKGINEIWLGKDDFLVYKDEQMKVAKAVAHRTDITPENRLKMLKAAGELAFEQMRMMGAEPEKVKEAVEIMNTALEAILVGSDVSPMLQILENSNSTVYSHSVNSAVLAATYTKLMGWSSRKTTDALVLSSFLHDLALCELPMELQRKHPLRMTKTETALFQTHPQRAYEILRAMKDIPKEVPTIILQHHENSKGTGYPLGLSKSDIQPLARVVSLIDCYLEEWERITPEKRAEANAATLTLTRMIQKDPLAFERQDVQALELALSDMDITRARHKLQSQIQGGGNHN